MSGKTAVLIGRYVMGPAADASGSSDNSGTNGAAEAVNAYLASVVEERPFPDNLTEAIEYALLGQGKRLRPILLIRACEAVGGHLALAMPAAAAIEMVHCFSLVHDDLPAMDDDDLRRGRPTLHRHSGEAMAILAADALSALAFEVLATRLGPPGVAASVAAELATATNDMIAGQVYDTIGGFEDSTRPADRLGTVHRHKTAALIRAACRMGSVCGGGSSTQLEALTRYGESIGLMFQVVDDLLDVTQTTEHLGKKARKDAEKGKLTYPGVLGVDASRAEVEHLAAQAREALEPLGERAAPLREMCDYMAVRTR